MMAVLHNRVFFVAFLIVLIGVFVFAGFLLVANKDIPSLAQSVEFGITALSPNGVEGGFIIPASCPSYEHTAGECSPPTFNCTPGSVINEGESCSLAWSCVNSTSSSGVNFSTGGATSGSVGVTPTSDTTFTVVCSNGGQTSVTVTVLHPATSISANPTRVRSGNASIITWSASGVDQGSCQVNGPSGVFATGDSGSKSTGALTNQSTYTLVCQTQAGQTSESVIVNIIPSFEEF